MSSGEIPANDKKNYDDISYEVPIFLTLATNKADLPHQLGKVDYSCGSPGNGNKALHSQIYPITFPKGGENLP
jgi:hypothetical protein